LRIVTRTPQTKIVDDESVSFDSSVFYTDTFAGDLDVTWTVYGERAKSRTSVDLSDETPVNVREQRYRTSPLNPDTDGDTDSYVLQSGVRFHHRTLDLSGRNLHERPY
jgi:hypothetical protein